MMMMMMMMMMTICFIDRFVGVQLRFWMQAFLVLAVFIGVGYHLLCNSLHLPSILRIIIMIAVLVLQLVINLPSVDPLTRTNTYLYHYGRAQLDPLPEKAIYITHGDCQQNSVMYLQQCEHVREDVSVIYLAYASYMWYNHSQLSLYPEVNWPGVVYHHYGSVLRGEGGNAFNLTYDLS